MRRIALISSALLPLPFAALPLVAVMFSSEPPVGQEDLAITTEVAPLAGGMTEAVSFATGAMPELPCPGPSNVT